MKTHSEGYRMVSMARILSSLVPVLPGTLLKCSLLLMANAINEITLMNLFIQTVDLEMHVLGLFIRCMKDYNVF